MADAVKARGQVSLEQAALDTQPGDYQLKITVKDLANGKAQSLTGNVKVLPRDFALVRTTTSRDVDGQYPASVFVCGQGVWVHCRAVDFARNPAGKQPNVLFEIRVLDASGRPTLPKPMTHAVNGGVPDIEHCYPRVSTTSRERWLSAFRVFPGNPGVSRSCVPSLTLSGSQRAFGVQT
jgi:hypothetical protein